MREGYKKTEIGVIPVEWEVVKLGDICKFKQGIQIPIEEQDTKQNDDKIRFLRISDYTQNTDDIRYVSNNYSDYLITDNDIVMVRYGETAGFIGTNLSGVLANNLFSINPNKQINKRYLYTYMNNEKIYNFLKSLRASGAMPAVNFKSLNVIKIPLPPLKEQQEIANILSTADKKIEAIDLQIQKAETLKKGLLQKLLSEGIGHSEFKDSELGRIPVGWEVVKVGNISNLTAGGTPRTSEKSYWYPQEVSWLSSGEVHKKKIFYTDNKISINGLDNSSAKLLPCNSILIALAGQGKTRGTVAITEIELTTNQSVGAILPNDKIIPYYLYYNLDSRYDELRSLSTGSGGRGGLNLSILKSINIQLPPLKEQKQIAQILSTADKKLEVLRAKKEKYETLKKGLLQKLLSGEVRVGCCP